MRIAIVANTSWYIYNFRASLIRTLQQDGHEVLAVAPRDAYVEKLTAMGVRHYDLSMSRRGKNPLREIASCMKLFHLLRDTRPDVVLTFTVKCNLYTGICRRFLKFEQIANVPGLGEAFEKGGFVNFIVCCLYKRALARSKRVFFQNDEDMRSILKRGLLPTALCRHIPGSGVDLDAFHPCWPPHAARARRFLMFGRLVPKKGYDLFMKAAEDIRSAGNHDAEFWIMGMVDDSRKESAELLKRILDLQSKGVVKYLPPSDNVAAVLRQVDVVVLPSQYNEGVPRSLLEAMACGKPVITTDWKGCRDTVEHGKNGYLVKVGDRADLTRYVRQFLDERVERLHEMGIASRKKVEKEFDKCRRLT
jgi:glycosyltransferase involved in cell wall biosynthesis